MRLLDDGRLLWKDVLCGQVERVEFPLMGEVETGIDDGRGEGEDRVRTDVDQEKPRERECVCARGSETGCGFWWVSGADSDFGGREWEWELWR
jgi:hypothetical protein